MSTLRWPFVDPCCWLLTLCWPLLLIVDLWLNLVVDCWPFIDSLWTLLIDCWRFVDPLLTLCWPLIGPCPPFVDPLLTLIGPCPPFVHPMVTLCCEHNNFCWRTDRFEKQWPTFVKIYREALAFGTKSERYGGVLFDLPHSIFFFHNLLLPHTLTLLSLFDDAPRDSLFFSNKHKWFKRQESTVGTFALRYAVDEVFFHVQ